MQFGRFLSGNLTYGAKTAFCDDIKNNAKSQNHDRTGINEAQMTREDNAFKRTSSLWSYLYHQNLFFV